MANKNRGQVKANFDGKPLNLNLSIDAICQLEEYYDLPIHEIFSKFEDSKKTRMKDVVAMFWSLMLEAKPDATFDDAKILIGGLMGNHDKILGDAVRAAFPAAYQDDDAGK